MHTEPPRGQGIRCRPTTGHRPGPWLHDSILHGLELTLWLTAAVMAGGYVLGIGIAAMRLSANPCCGP